MERAPITQSRLQWLVWREQKAQTKQNDAVQAGVGCPYSLIAILQPEVRVRALRGAPAGTCLHFYVVRSKDTDRTVRGVRAGLYKGIWRYRIRCVYKMQQRTGWRLRGRCRVIQTAQVHTAHAREPMMKLMDDTGGTTNRVLRSLDHRGIYMSYSRSPPFLCRALRVPRERERFQNDPVRTLH